MNRRFVLLALVSMLLLLSIVTQFTVQVKAQPKTIYVDDDNTAGPWDGTLGYPYQNITSALGHASDNDTIYVYKGTYYEHVVVNKTVSLIGENRSTTIIDASGAGTVIKLTANNVNVTGFTIQNGGTGLADCGIFIGNCTGNTISNNIIRKNYNGLWLSASNSNKIVDNIIIDKNAFGIKLSNSNNNQIIGNTIAHNPTGANIMGFTIPNTFYHNNFLNNSDQVFSEPGTYWDNGTEGNYWSDYMGVDTNGDGVGDTLLPHEGEDSYPLIIPTRPFPVIWGDVIYPVALFGNSTVSRFYFSQPSKEIGFNVTGLLNKTGFCDVTIPKKLLRAEPLSAWAVSVDGQLPLSLNLTDNATHSFLYFTYNHSAQRIQIIGTDVVPEFPAAIFLTLFLIFTLVVAVLRKRGKERHDSSSFKPKTIFHAFPSYSRGNKRKRLIPYALLP